MNSRKRLIVLNLIVMLVLVAAIPAAPRRAFAQPGGPNFQVETLTPDNSFDAAFEGKPTAAPPSRAQSRGASDLISVVAKLDFAPLTQYSGGIDGLAPTSPVATGAAHLDAESSASQSYLAYANARINAFASALQSAIPTAQITHRYTVVIGGAAVVLPASQLAALSKLPGVQAVYADRLEQPQTDASPAFIGADTIWAALGGQESAGDGVVVGVLDTGIWPEHPSFSDPDPSGKAYTKPAGWHGTSCEFGNTEDANDPAFTCNNKLVGAERFMATYDLLIAPVPGEFATARDDDGHGTHTASTSAGNAGVEASIFGVDRGVISGIAPRASVAMYKVCGDSGCYNTDSAAAIQQAILDGVDAINFSISGGGNPYADVASLAFLDAYTAGVFVAASAGNSGPGADTTDHREPWVTTVAASTSNRHFISTVTLSASDGATKTLEGASITAAIITPTKVVNAADFDGLPANSPSKGLCASPFSAGTFNGEIVICKRGVNARVNKGFNVLQGGAGGMLLYNPGFQGVNTDNHYLPAVHLEKPEGDALLAFMGAHTGVLAAFTTGIATAVPGDKMAAFSSRGGPGQALGVSKPDVTAPGLQILAGHSPLSASADTGPHGELFQAIAGTSMSSPHVAGAGALLRALHPDWTPGQIKSALMTTAKLTVVKEDGATPADFFDYGSGRINLDFAGDPGLTFDASAQEYLDKAANLWDSNYPSLYVPALAGKITVERTVRSLFPTRSFWTLSVTAPSDLKVTVPSGLWLAGFGSTSFDITVDASMAPVGQVRMALLTLTSGDYVNHFPITVVRRDTTITLSKTCDPADLYLGDSTACHITATNNSFSDAVVNISDFLPKQLQLDVASVTGAVAAGNDLMYTGQLYGAEPPNVDVVNATGDTPAGYLPLSGFGVAPQPGFSDDNLFNYNVPAFVFAGETYTRIGVTSNGAVIVGGGAAADATPSNQNLPSPARPNNVLAAFWSDLNVGAGGAVRVASLRDGAMRWLVVDWEKVPNFGNKAPNSFQIWIGLNGVQDIAFTYDEVSKGDNDKLTVGAENKFGNRGKSWYYNGAGTVVAKGTELRVTATAAEAGETHHIHYNAKGVVLGDWMNVAEMTSAAFPGVVVAGMEGMISQRPPQPVTVQLPLMADTWVNGGQQTVNFDDYAALIGRTTGLDNVLLTFDRSALPAGANLQSATLTLRFVGESGTKGKSLTAWNVNAFDSTAVTYKTAPLSYNPGSAVALPAAAGHVNFNVKAQVAAWDAAGAQASSRGFVASAQPSGSARGAAGSKGLLAVSASGPLGRVIFDSLESFQGHPATLTVTYMP